MSEEIKVEYIRLDEIKMPVRNPKGHEIGELGRSIDRFGYVSPMIVNENTGRLVAGKGRYDALVGKRLKGMDVPKRVLVDHDGMWRVPVVRIAFSTDEEAEAYVLADNRLTELGGIEDEGMLLDMLIDLQTQGDVMLEGIGYDGDDIDELFKRVKGGGLGEEEKEGEEGYRSEWMVLVECEDEAQQAEVLEKLMAEGYKCRALVS